MPSADGIYAPELEELGAQSQPPIDPERVQNLLADWARHEAWFQLGRCELESYPWPLIGTYEIATEGESAYFAYRDYLAATALAFNGAEPLLRDLRRLLDHVEELAPGEVAKLLEPDGGDDTHFHMQWHNLFSPDPVWNGVTHESLALYARKYEVERPLRTLACLRSLIETGKCDLKLRGFRDRRGRLQKGRLVEYLTDGFKTFEALRAALTLGYSSRLRNAIGHNDYEIADGTVSSVDGSFAESEATILSRMLALGTLQNALIWVSSIRRHDPSSLAAKGVVGVGWATTDDDSRALLMVCQLAPFREFDPNASWLDKIRIAISGDRVATTVGQGRERTGPINEVIRTSIDHIQQTGAIACVVVGVVPCLHHVGAPHAAYQLGPHLYCEWDAIDVGQISAVVTMDPAGIDGNSDAKPTDHG